MKKNNFYIALLVMYCFSSCNKDDRSEPGLVKVQTSVVSLEYKSASDLNKQASILNSEANKIDYQVNTIKVNEGYNLVATLMEEDIKQEYELNKIASIDLEREKTSLMDDNVYYKVCVFDDAGNLISEKNQIKGKEGNDEILLDGGKEYTFIAYTINEKTSNLPALKFTNNVQKLENAYIDTDGTKKLSYQKIQKTFASHTTNKVNFVLQHQFSELNLVIGSPSTNSSGSTNSMISAAEISTDHYSNASLNLYTGSMTRSSWGSRGKFSTLADKITFAPIIVNLEEQISNFKLMIEIDQLIRRNVEFSFNIKPRTKYFLSLNLVREDAYLQHASQYAVRINGKIWMRANLGNTLSTPQDFADLENWSSNSNSVQTKAHGNYYQWGRQQIVATANRRVIDHDLSFLAANNNWNLNTTDKYSPSKNTKYDPCPTGYRVPTRFEILHLVNSNNVSNTGTFSLKNGNFDDWSAAIIFTSKTNSSVRMIFPIQAVAFISTAEPYEFSFFARGETGSTQNLPDATVSAHSTYLTSSAPGIFTHDVGSPQFYRLGNNGISYINRNKRPQDFLFPLPIRCIAEND